MQMCNGVRYNIIYFIYSYSDDHFREYQNNENNKYKY